MNSVSELAQSNEYLSFRSSVPLRKIYVDTDGNKAWKIFDSGPKSVTCPLICLPPVSGTADVFFKQILGLGSRGVRVIAAESPAYWSVKEWCAGLRKLLDALGLQRVHLFGASLGGFLAQKFSESVAQSGLVCSLVLCNTFTDTAVFSQSDAASLFWLLPSLLLKRMLMGNLGPSTVDASIADAVDFMVERLESLERSELASRLTLNCSGGAVQCQLLSRLPITVLDVWDEGALSAGERARLAASYPHARRAHLKTGGNFPYLSRSDEVDLHLLIHLRQFEGTPDSAAYTSLFPTYPPPPAPAPSPPPADNRQ